MILSAHQPAYLPWLGYFDKIARADVFIYLDTVQFEKNSFINRNRIKTPQGPQWITIPIKVKGHLSATLRATEIESSQPWPAKHLKSIRMNYSRAAFYEVSIAKLEQLLVQPHTNLAELCWQQLLFWLKEFRIKTRIVRSSELDVSGSKSGLILALCRHFGADRYLSGTLGRSYLQPEEFATSKIAVLFQDYVSPVYDQLWGEFVPNLSIVDYWMNCGAETLRFGSKCA